MMFKRSPVKLKEDKRTTIAGASAVGISIITALLPSEVRDQCFNSILEADNPTVTLTLLVSGVGLILWGPSIAKSK